MNPETLAAELHTNGHLRDHEWPQPSAEPTAGSRWILALQIIGGWLSAIFLLAFLGAGAVPLIQGASAWIILGVVLSLVAGFAAAHVGGTVVRQMLLIVGLAGHGALLYGVSTGMSMFMVSAYEIFLLVCVAWAPYRLIAGLVACGALLSATFIVLGEAFMLSAVVALWLVACLLEFLEPRWLAKPRSAPVQALTYALFLSSLGSLWLDSVNYYIGLPDEQRWIFSANHVLLAVVNAVFAVLLAQPLLAEWRGRAGVALLLAAQALTWTVPAIGMDAIAMVLGFSRGHAWLAWLGGAVLVWGVGNFYYDLQTTLLIKSGLTIAGGFLLLAVRVLLMGGERR